MSSNVSTVVNYFPTVNEGFITTTSGNVSSAGTVVPLNGVSGLSNGTVFVGIIEPGATNQQVFTGTVDITGSQITGVKWTRGTNVPHTSGVTVVDYITGTLINMISVGLQKQHKQSGAHSAVTADSLTVSGSTNLTTLAASGASTFSGNVTVSGQLQVTAGTTVTVDGSGNITPTSQVYTVTALDANATIQVPSFTAWDGAALVLRIKGAATHNLSFASAYSNISGMSLITATTAGKWHVIGALYNAAVSQWQIVSVTTET